MTFSPEWERLYASGRHISVWPWTELVSLVMRYARPQERKTDPRVLELGCGAGANIPFIRSFEGQYHGVDSSATALEGIRGRYGNAVVVEQGDFCEALPFSGLFDIVIDRAALTHNRTEGIRKSLELVRGCLSPGGLYFGIHWFSTSCAEYRLGTATSDPYVRTGYSEGVFSDVGVVHFCDRTHLEELFSPFRIRFLEHVVSTTELPERRDLGWWNIVCGL